jgi:hypothetical protein
VPETEEDVIWSGAHLNGVVAGRGVALGAGMEDRDIPRNASLKIL